MIVHYTVLDKFIEPFINLINKEFDSKKHVFLAGGDSRTYLTKKHENLKHISSFYQLPMILFNLYKSDKIIIHGLFHVAFTFLLYLNPFLLKKTYWVIWGGDLHHAIDEKNNKTLISYCRNKVIKNMGNCITYIKGDYDLIKKEFNSRAKLIECFMYPSNIFKRYALDKVSNEYTVILMGNSATQSNNHFDSFAILKKYKYENIKIYCPLSYGDKEYGLKVAKEGNKIFGDKFMPLFEFIQFNNYIKILNEVDIVLFNHDRQQAMGNTIALLGIGKKLYIRKDTGVWDSLKEIGLIIFDISNFNLSDEELDSNTEIISEYFCYENLVKQLKNLFFI